MFEPPVVLFSRENPSRSAPRRAAAALALLLGACRAEPAPPAPPPPAVSVARAAAVELIERIDATGELLAKEHAEIAAEVGGRITEVLLDEGSAAEAGAAVLEIDPERRRLERDAARAELEEARASRSEQQREVARVAQLRERTVASKTALEQAQTALALARSRVAGAEARLGMAERLLRDATVRAPFSGLIARRLVSRGEYVEAGQTLFELVSLDPIEVEFHLAERDSSRVRLGQAVEVRVAPYPDELFRAVVSTIAPTIDSDTRTLRVKALLENRQGRLRPGLFARVDLGVARREGVTMVPEEAVLQRADGPVVFRLDADDRVERLAVELGVIRDGRVEVARGLAPGDRVVARGAARLVHGALVTPRHLDGQPLDGGPPDAVPEIAEASPP